MNLRMALCLLPGAISMAGCHPLPADLQAPGHSNLAPEKAVDCFWDDAGPTSRNPAELDEHVSRLLELRDMPSVCNDLCAGGPGCGDARFWRVVRDGRAVIPLLVERLDDASPTNADAPHGGKYAMGDIVRVALTEILPDLPVAEFAGAADSEELWKHLRANAANRSVFKRRAAEWVEQHESELVWRPGDSFVSLRCAEGCAHPAGGHYALKTPARWPL